MALHQVPPPRRDGLRSASYLDRERTVHALRGHQRRRLPDVCAPPHEGESTVMAPRTGHVFVSLEERLWRKISPEPNTGCWLWTGADNGAGYGTLTFGHSKRAYAHRVSYEHFVGPIPDGLQLDHKCRVPCCVNPDHLEPVSNAENTRRGALSALRPPRETCKRGHKLALTAYVDSQGHTQCRECLRIRQTAYRRRAANVAQR